MLPINDDLLEGAKQIAQYTGNSVRRIYYLADRGAIPAFHIGKTLCARKSELDMHYSADRRAPSALNDTPDT
jgi:excisionase family DNA binding protein